jgi:hypothetical protein
MKIDGFVKSLKTAFSVLPAKAGIQYFQMVLDACLRRHDGVSDFLRVCQRWTFDAYSPPPVGSMFIFETNPARHEYNL